MCATMRWSGRTDRPSTVQPRCSVSNVRTMSQPAAERLDEVLHLRDGRHVDAEDAAGPQAPLDVRQRAPRLGEVEDDAVDVDGDLVLVEVAELARRASRSSGRSR